MKALKIVTVVGLTAYGLRIAQGLWMGIGIGPLLPYAGAWVSWIGLASWQRVGIDWTEWEERAKEEEEWSVD